jgi:glycosyltransferase involved in cell wall biosynthesis
VGSLAANVPGAARVTRSLPPLRALHIGNTSGESNGGAERYYFNLLRALPACGVTGSGIVFGAPEPVTGAAAVIAFAAAESGLLTRWSGLRRSTRAALSGCDLVASHFALYAFPVLDTFRARPMVAHFHGPWAAESAAEGAGRATTIAKRMLERIVYARSTRLIVLSQAFATVVERDYGIARDKIRVIPGGVDLARFTTATTRDEAKVALGWPTDRPIVLSVRRLVHAKGLENLIDAVSTIRRSVPDVLVVIAGAGPLAADLKRRVTELQLDHHVQFAGFVPESQLPTLYRAADLFVVPTIALEGFGLVVVEALACGTPVLVTPIAGLPEVIADLDPALVLPGAAKNDLAQGISDALTGRLPLPTDAQCIAYAQRFAWSAIAPRIAAVYREVA